MSNKYMSAIRHETLTNKGKIDNLEPLWSHYSELLDKFMKEMNYNLVRGNGVIKKTPPKYERGFYFVKKDKLYFKSFFTHPQGGRWLGQICFIKKEK